MGQVVYGFAALLAAVFHMLHMSPGANLSHSLAAPPSPSAPPCLLCLRCRGLPCPSCCGPCHASVCAVAKTLHGPAYWRLERGSAHEPWEPVMREGSL
eukprot:365408-Chlamydomonas_euryale.AAC.16